MTGGASLLALAIAAHDPTIYFASAADDEAALPETYSASPELVEGRFAAREKGFGRLSPNGATLALAAPAPPAPTGSMRRRVPGEDEPGLNEQRANPAQTEPGDADETLIEGRRRPGVPQGDLPDAVTQDNPGAVRAPPPSAFPTDQIPIPDRWRIVETLGLVQEDYLDPYHQNTLKGDRPIPIDELPGWLSWLPIHGDDWFFVGSAVSDTVIEPRSFPTPVGVQTTQDPDSLDVFGTSDSQVFAQTFLTSAALIKGSTAFKPPEIEYRVTLATQFSYADVSERRILFVEPSKSSHRFDWFTGVQELFVDYHIRNTSRRYDFDSIRVGIQPFNADFRGFLFQDNQLGIRLFGTRDNNRWQYNFAAFWRVEKDTNSGLNDIFQTPRSDWVFHANLYRQDLPFPGLTSQVSVTWNMNREAGDIEIDDNGFPVRPALIGNLRGRDYDAIYLGYNADGHIGRLNLTASAYLLLGEDRNSIFTDEAADIFAYFGAAELSYDRDWIRFRLSGLYASGDGDPYDGTEHGFDAIFENPLFAGADTSYWIRQSIPFAGGGRVIGVNGRNGVLNSLRSSKEQGQSNFNNPGTILVGVGTDFDITPPIPPVAQRQPSLVRRHRDASGAAQRGQHPDIDRL